MYVLYTRVNKNPSVWNFLSPKPEVKCGTVAILIRVVLLSPYAVWLIVMNGGQRNGTNAQIWGK